MSEAHLSIPGLSAAGAKLLAAAGMGTLELIDARPLNTFGFKRRLTVAAGLSPLDEAAVESAVIAWRASKEQQ